MEVKAWLEEPGFEEYAVAFAKDRVDEEVLPTPTEAVVPPVYQRFRRTPFPCKSKYCLSICKE